MAIPLILRGAAFLASIAINATLSLQLITLTRQQATVQAISEIRTNQVVVGKKLPPLRGRLLNGEETTIAAPSNSQGTVIYVFGASCHWCARNLENMRAVEQQTRDRYHFVGVALSEDGLDRYVEENSIQYPVLRSVSDQLRTQYGLWATPETIFVSPAGVVEGVWMGAYDQRQQAEVEAALNVKLPGLLPDKKN
jgi:peroxiredoxin